MAVYDAFISYSHAKDKPVAAALQSVVQKLGKPWYRRRALRIFRDDTSLSATPSLWPSIEQALAQSRYLILMASPEAAGSHWVNKEVAYWLEHKSAETLLIALTDGDLAWDNAAGDFTQRETALLPPALVGRFPSEPKWIDLRPYRDGADPRDSRFVEAGADFAGAIHGIPKEDLLSQEVRQQRRALRLAWSAAGSLLLLAGLAGWQWKVAVDNERAAVRNFNIARQAGEDVVSNLARGLRNVQGMRVESVRQILSTAQELMDGLAQAVPDDLPLLRSRSVMFNAFVDTYLAAGDIASAKAASEESLLIARKLAVNPNASSSRLRDLAISLQRVGDVRNAEGNVAGALAAYSEALEISRKFVAAAPGDEQPQRDMTAFLEKIGDLRRATKDGAGALTAFEEGLAIRRKLAAAVPAASDRQHDLMSALDRVGDMRIDAGDRAGAAAAYEEGSTIARKFAEANPGDVEWQRALSISLAKIGDVRLAEGDRIKAIASYDGSLAIVRKLVVLDPGNMQLLRDMAAPLSRLGEAQLAHGNHKGALAASEEALVLMRKFAAARPDNSLVRVDIAGLLMRIGDIQYAVGNRTAALTAFEENLAVRRALASADTSNVPRQLEFVFGLFKVATVVDTPRVRVVLREAIAILENLGRENKLPAAQRIWLDRFRDALAKLPPEQAKTR